MKATRMDLTMSNISVLYCLTIWGGGHDMDNIYRYNTVHGIHKESRAKRLRKQEVERVGSEVTQKMKNVAI